MQVACAREFDQEERLTKMTLFGTSAEVMEHSLLMMPERAAAKNLSEERDEVYSYSADEAIAQYSEEELNLARPYGFERIVFVKGELYLLIVKSTDASEATDSDDEEVGGDDDATAMQFDSGTYATGNAPCVVVDWLRGQWIEVEVVGNVQGRRLRVPLMWRTVRDDKSGKVVSVPLWPLKPYDERVIDLAQGLEWTKPVEVVTSKIYGEGKLYVAITRARSLGMLKVTGVEPSRAGLKEVLRSSWRALHWMQEKGEPLPTPQQRYVSTMKRKYDTAFPTA